MDYLSEQLNLLEITFGKADNVLLQRRDDYREQYKQQSLVQAKDAFEADGYEAAVQVLNNAQGKLGEEDPEIAEASAYYRQQGPIWLAELDYFHREEGGFELCEEMVKDNLGNTHKMVIGVADGVGYNGPEMVSQTYRLGARYD